jgi:hypothetical protein
VLGWPKRCKLARAFRIVLGWPKRCKLARAFRIVLGWPKGCKLVRAFRWEHSDKRLELAQLLGQLGVFPTLYSTVGVRYCTVGFAHITEKDVNEKSWPRSLPTSAFHSCIPAGRHGPAVSSQWINPQSCSTKAASRCGHVAEPWPRLAPPRGRCSGPGVRFGHTAASE